MIPKSTSLELVIIRGLPGSGKSTLAKQLGYDHFEADMFHMVNGVYQWKAFLVGKAHEWCQSKTVESLKAGRSVVVSNTFTRIKEMKFYLEAARELNIPVRVFVATGKYKNVHSVPEDALSKMAARWENYESEVTL